MSDGDASRASCSLAAGVERVAERLDGDPLVAGFVRWARRHLPGQDVAVDPLSLGPGLATDLALRLAPVAAHRPSVLRELGSTALQLWQAQHGGERAGGDSGELAVLFTDIAGFSDWTLEVGDEVALTALTRIAEVVEPAVARRGTLVKRLGDGLMVVFPDPSDALAAAEWTRDLVDGLDPEAMGGHRLRQRAGVHLGRPRFDGGDYFGRDVNIAARIADAAEGGEVCVSDAVCRVLGPGSDGRFRPRTDLNRKGVPDDVEVHVLVR